MTTPVIADLSSAQGVVNWAQLAGTVDGVILKATEGTGYRDPQFSANVAGAVGHGVPILGVYHFPRPDLGNTGKAEGEWFAFVVAGLHVPRILDIEPFPGVPYSRWVSLCTPDWMWALCLAAGVSVDYGNRGDLSSAVRGDQRFAAHRVWVAAYPGGTPAPTAAPTAPPPWSRPPDMWQFTDAGRRPGVGGNVDLSYAYTATPAPAPPAPPQTITGDLSTVTRHPVSISTDASGNGGAGTDIPWAGFLSATHLGSDPDVHADGTYWPGSVHAQERNGNVLLTLTGARPNSTETVFVATTT